jgi:hypothetical protein
MTAAPPQKEETMAGNQITIRTETRERLAARAEHTGTSVPHLTDQILRTALDNEDEACPIPAKHTRVGGATLSDCGRYRYHLWRSQIQVEERRWGRVLWIMLNPSTADASVNDPTIRRCLDYTARWGAERMDVINLFGVRLTDSRELIHRAKEGDCVGPENDLHIGVAVEQAMADAGLVICAWGCNGRVMGRANQVEAELRRTKVPLHHLRMGGTAGSRAQDPKPFPVHPLYQRASLKPIPWAP